MNDTSRAGFTGLIDLASETLGGKALSSNDDFFAGKENLLKLAPAVFIEGKFTERGKWMDGWESRRKRGPGHDWCIIELGAPGEVLGFDVDTAHFLGNHPPFASIDGLFAPRGTPLDELERGPWRELLEQAPLRPGSQNLFTSRSTDPVSHVRLNMFPDGGIARFRVYGRVHGAGGHDVLDDETRAHVPSGLASGLGDLVAVKNGGLALACSDAFFGPMNNLLLPGRAENMGGGWETRRRRGPGFDWIIVKLGTRGVAKFIEVDTNHFCGNFPDRCSIDAIDAPGARITELIAHQGWTSLLPEKKLGASQRHFFGDLPSHGAASHLRLNIFPDGGVSRLRVWGVRDA